MIRTDAWQLQTVEELRTRLSANDHVVAVALFGSTASNQKADSASDLDFLVIVREEKLSQFFPAIDWLKPFGEVFAVQRFENELHGTVRICFSDFRRFDIVLTTPSKLHKLEASQHNPIWQGVQLLFSRSPDIEKYLTQTWQPPTPTFPSQAEFEEMADNFWFKAMLASYKVLRNDRLIASHLALDLARDGCVTGMILRDRATGTNIHHEGGEGNDLIDMWEAPLNSYSASDILDGIERSCILFDQLASRWSDTYQKRQVPMSEWLGYIRNRLSTEE